MKRMMQRQGQEEADSSPAPEEAPASRPRSQPAGEGRNVGTKVVEFGREVRSEMRQVAWPSRDEVVNSATVVLITLILLVGVIFLLNYGFSHAETFLLKP